MNVQRLFVLPTLLRGLRTDRQLSQKALAVSAAIDQSRLCAVEKGRSAPPDHQLLERLASALELTPGEQKKLIWAREHDKLIVELERSALAPAADTISQLLRATEFLSEEELAGLAFEIKSVGDSKRRLRALTRAPRTTTLTEGGPL